MDQIVIEKNIPISGRRKPTKYPWVQMQVGDSFVVPCEPAERKKLHISVGASARNYSTKNPGYKFSLRTELAGIRVWRIAA